jgi:hypothetical protein
VQDSSAHHVGRGQNLQLLEMIASHVATASTVLKGIPVSTARLVVFRTALKEPQPAQRVG